MKTYTTRSNAKRAGMSLATKFAEEVKVLIVESEPLDGGFVPSLTIENPMRAASTELLLSALIQTTFVEPEPLPIENDCRKPVIYSETGDPVDPATIPAAAEPKLNKSSVQHPCKEVWNIAEQMHNDQPGVKRKEVLAACVDRGIAYYTARTQYQAWLTVCKEMREREAAQGKK